MVLTGWCLYLRQKGPERIMISMPQVQSIRRLRRNGESVASIARKTHVSEPTVRKYLAKEDLSAVPSVRKPRASVIDPYLPVICIASMFVGRVRQCFSAVWADGFPRCRHRFPVM